MRAPAARTLCFRRSAAQPCPVGRPSAHSARRPRWGRAAQRAVAAARRPEHALRGARPLTHPSGPSPPR
eukprot:10595741-Alexandrium_andersonii.AAC.1